MHHKCENDTATLHQQFAYRPTCWYQVSISSNNSCFCEHLHGEP